MSAQLDEQHAPDQEGRESGEQRVERRSSATLETQFNAARLVKQQHEQQLGWSAEV